MKILIVGLGSIGRKHVAAILNVCATAQIYALRSGHKSSDLRNVINLYSLDDFDLDLDFIVISNITYLHEKTIMEMCRFRCPLFIEKPVLHSLENYETISTELKSNKIATYVACNLRFHPAIEFLREYLAEDEDQINEVNIYCGSYLPHWRPDQTYKSSYSANKTLGGGVHLDLIHELDYCTWIFGFPIKSEAVKRSGSSLKIDSIDFAHFVLYYRNFVASITLNYFRRDPKREIEIVTEKKTILVDLISGVIIDKVSNKILFEEHFDVLQTYDLQMNYFMESIAQRTSVMNDFNHAVNVLKLALDEPIRE